METANLCSRKGSVSAEANERCRPWAMFSQILRSRSAKEIEDSLIVGTSRTTPALIEIQTTCPTPWLFSKLLVFCGAIFLGLMTGYFGFHNEALLPGLILIGTLSVPVVMTILFFEFNSPKNVSLYRVAIFFSVGGLLSVLFSILGGDVGHLHWCGPWSAGVTEEVAKVIALILVGRGTRYKYMLNGMLFGAAVGAGFCSIERAGLALRALQANGVSAMLESIALSAVFTPLTHVAWTAMTGAALWSAKKTDLAPGFACMAEPRFQKVLLLAILLHTSWNLYCPEPPFQPKEIMLGAAAWVAGCGIGPRWILLVSGGAGPSSIP